MPSKNSPVGIFDSGIGGLTVAKAIKNVLPSEDFIYFGDTAHMPYGEKSPEAIKAYSIAISKFLLSQSCKAIVIACNTASALAFDEVKELLGTDIPLINVIDPVIEEIGKMHGIKHPGVIGTRATVNSGVYEKKLKSKYPLLDVVSVATPLFAQMIEEGFYNNSVSREVIRAYLKNEKFRNIDSLILACTHYPLLQDDLADFFWSKVQIIDSPSIVANYLKQVLQTQNLLNSNQGNHPNYQFIVSDYTETFERISKQFFNENISLKEVNIW